MKAVEYLAHIVQTKKVEDQEQIKRFLMEIEVAGICVF